jgi:sulfur carrier protein
MKITVSGEPTTVKDGISVAELIKEKDVENPQYVTVTVNDDFIESGSFEDTTLSEGDQVEFLYFMGGGC